MAAKLKELEKTQQKLTHYFAVEKKARELDPKQLKRWTRTYNWKLLFDEWIFDYYNKYNVPK